MDPDRSDGEEERGEAPYGAGAAGYGTGATGYEENEPGSSRTGRRPRQREVPETPATPQPNPPKKLTSEETLARKCEALVARVSAPGPAGTRHDVASFMREVDTFVQTEAELTTLVSLFEYQGFDPREMLMQLVRTGVTAEDVMFCIVLGYERGPAIVKHTNADKAKISTEGWKLLTALKQKVNLTTQATRNRKAVTLSRIIQCFPRKALEYSMRTRAIFPVAPANEFQRAYLSQVMPSMIPQSSVYCSNIEEALIECCKASVALSKKIDKKFASMSPEQQEEQAMKFVRIAHTSNL